MSRSMIGIPGSDSEAGESWLIAGAEAVTVGRKPSVTAGNPDRLREGQASAPAQEGKV